jgi:serine/threonine protein kinase
MAKVFHAGTREMTPGEQRALAVLEQLSDAWTIIATKILPLGHADSREIDFILIGPHRLYVFDEKSYHGTITGTDEVWTLNSGWSERSPFNKIDMVAKQLASFVKDKVPAFPPRTVTVNSVVAGIILSNDTAQAQINDPRATRCLMHLTNALAKLDWLDREGADAGFDLGPIHHQIQIAIYNDNRARRPKRPRMIDLYRIEATLEERRACRIFRAVHENGSERTLYVYENSPTGQSVPEATIDHHLNALRRLQASGIVPAVSDSFLWMDEAEYRVVPVARPDGAAIGNLPRPASEAAAIREVEIAAAAFAALDTVHENGIIHRAIAPDALFMRDDTPPTPGAREASLPRVMFDGFVAAHVDQTVTIAPQLDAQAAFDDPYAAPEIVRLQSYAYADRTSDVYSLALVTLERLSNLDVQLLIAGLASEPVTPALAEPWPYLPAETVIQLRAAFASALTTGPYGDQPRATAGEMAAMLAGIARELRQRTPWQKGPVPGTPYEIHMLLGQGASARTYLVYDHEREMLFAAKQYFGPAAIRDEAVREFQVLWPHRHPNLPGVYSLDRHSPHFQIMLEWIAGESLRQRVPHLVHDRATWANLMHDLLGAVEHLEQHGILHGDIKPENVMMREADGRAFLIDYGVSSSADQPGPIAGSPRYWPPEWRLGETRPKDSDRYAVAVTLFEALTGVLPFKTVGADFSSDPLTELPAKLPPDLQAVAHVLLRAIAIDPAARFGSITSLRAALDQALAGEPPNGDGPSIDLTQMNTWIGNVRRLFRNSRHGNADNRGLDTPFARETYVPTALDTKLWPAILAQKPAAVFLSGNPGDGKTAFLEQARTLLREDGATVTDETDPSGWEATLAGHAFRACFDASESAAGRSADAQLGHRLRGLEGERPDAAVTVLVAINDGRLAEVRERFAAEFPWLIEQIAHAVAHGSSVETINDPVWVVDLKQRSYVRLVPDEANPSVMRQMLAAMVEPARSAIDESALAGLPVAQNAAALQQTGPGVPADRLEFLLTLAHLRGDRHITVRDLRSALALLITADLATADGADRDREQFPHPWSAKYWQTIFTTDASRDLVLGELRWLDPARFAHPALERFLYFRHRPEDAPERAKLFVDGTDEPPPAGDDPAALKAWIDAVKRRLVLEGAPPTADSPIALDPDSLLPYQSARDVIAVLAGRKEPETLLPVLLRGIGRSEGIDEANATDGLVLRVKKSDEHDIEIVKTFRRDEFTLAVVSPPRESLIETTPRTLLLEHPDSSARVTLNLDIIEVLTRLADGLDPASQELQPLLEELIPFKSQLQRGTSNRLLVIEGGRKHWISKQGEQIIRQDA